MFNSENPPQKGTVFELPFCFILIGNPLFIDHSDPGIEGGARVTKKSGAGFLFSGSGDSGQHPPTKCKIAIRWSVGLLLLMHLTNTSCPSFSIHTNQEHIFFVVKD